MMTDKKISQLTSATTPVAGTEVLPIVQSGSTVKVSVADLTVGRSISTAGASLDGAVVINETGANVDFRVEGDSDQNLLVVDASADRVGINIGTPAAKFDIVGAYDANAPSTSSLPILRVNEGGAVSLWVSGQAYTGAWIQAIQDDGTNNLKQLTLQPLGSLVKVGGASDLELANGNLVIGTAGKGIADSSSVARVSIASGSTVVNESGADIDFRVEGDTDANLLVADAGADKVMVGTATVPHAQAKFRSSTGIQYDDIVNFSGSFPDGNVYTITGGGNGQSAFLDLEVLTFEGYRREVIVFYNNGGTWIPDIRFTTDNGTAPTFTVSAGGATVTVTVASTAGYSPRFRASMTTNMTYTP